MVSDKIKALLSMKGKKYNELATLFGISPQAMRNKLFVVASQQMN